MSDNVENKDNTAIDVKCDVSRSAEFINLYRSINKTLTSACLSMCRDEFNEFAEKVKLRIECLQKFNKQ